MTHVELKGLKGLKNLNELIHRPIDKKLATEKLEHIAIDDICPGKFQPRQKINQASLQDLARSIKSQGIIQPLITRKIKTGRYEIIAGERRWRAAKIAGLDLVPALVKEIDDDIALACALIENIQRENLNPIEEAFAFLRFKNDFKMTHLEISEMIGRSRTSITNTLRLLSLADPVKEWVRSGQLDMGHARTLLTLDANQQISLAKKIIKDGLNVREAEKSSRLVKLSDFSHNKRSLHENPYKTKYDNWSAMLSEKLLTKVTVKLNNKGIGKIIINVNSPEEIDRFVDHFKIEE